MSQKKPQLDKSDLIEALPLACANEQAAVEFLEGQRWAVGPCCPRCGSVAVYKMTDRATGERNRRFLWRCRDCKRQYSVRTGTVYEESLIPLHKWCRALWESASAKNGVSALEMSRRLQITYRAALFLMHRIRHGMAHNPEPDPKLKGEVEVDETYVGPRKWRYPQHGKNRPGTVRGTPKQPVLAMVEKGGEVRTRVIADVTGATLRAAMKDHIDPSAIITTDEWTGYAGTRKHFAGHKTVKHRAKEYVKPDGTTTNTIESFFSRVKRSLTGTWHGVSKRHLHRYMSHVAFLYNTRDLNDGDRTTELIRAMSGKRLFYRDPAQESA